MSDTSAKGPLAMTTDRDDLAAIPQAAIEAAARAMAARSVKRVVFGKDANGMINKGWIVYADDAKAALVAASPHLAPPSPAPAESGAVAFERASRDLRYAKQALDRETARAIKFGKRITALTAKVALLTEALKPFADGMNAYEQHCHDEMDWVPPPERYDDEFVEMLAITGNYVKLFKLGQLRAARRALSEPDKEEMI